MLLEARDVTFQTDVNGKFTHISPNCLALTGYLADELASGLLPPDWIIHPADYEQVIARAGAAIEAAAAPADSEAIECRIIRKDGQLRWVAIQLAPIYEDGRLAAVQGVAHDITAYKQAEQALRARTQELATLNLLAARLGQSLDPEAILAEALGILMDVLEAEFGGVYEAREDGPYPQVLQGLPAGFDEDIAQCLHRLSGRLGQVKVLREHLHEAGGQISRAGKEAGIQSWAALPLRDRGNVIGLIALASREYERFGEGDVDFLAAASEHISLVVRNARLFAEAQRRLTELVLLNEVGRAVTSTLDREVVLREILTRALEVLQSEAGSVLLIESGGDLVFAVAAGPSGEKLRGMRVPINSSLAGQAVRQARPLMVLDTQSDERLYRDVDAQTGLVTRNLLAVPLVVLNQVIGVLEVINKRQGQFTAADLGVLESLAQPAAGAIANARLYEEAVQRAEQLQRSQAQLVQSEKLAALGRLTTSLAHEINNPLQATLNFLHLSLDYAVDEAKRREYLEIARQETQRLANLVNTMLDFYRPTAGSVAGSDVNAVVERVLALVRKKLQSGNVQVELQLAANLPQVSGAPDQLAQVFLNLAVNAAEAMSDGGRLLIETRPAKRKRWVEVSFTDSGPGIAAADLPHIFEPFYTTKQAGLGLGLSVSYGIVEAQGGTITVSSQLGQGTVFTVRLLAVAPTRRRYRQKTV